MGRSIHNLSAINVTRFSTKPGAYCDGGGLWLYVSSKNASSWIFRYSAPKPFIGRDGKAKAKGTPREMGLGSFPAVPLAEARDRSAAARKLKDEGRDPLEERASLRAAEAVEQARAITFKDAAEKYIEANKVGWKSVKHAAQWSATLATYAYPVCGSLPVAAIDVTLVTQVLEPIWATKPETAGRVRGRIEAIIDWATARGYRVGENPARWRGHLENLLPSRGKVRRVEHHAALPYDEIPAFMAELRARDSVSARALEFTILTAARTGETIGAKPEEIKGHTWTVPAERMKSGKEHRVPLCDRAMEILGALRKQKGNPYLFVGGRAGRPLSNMAMLELMRGMRPDYVPHGFRSTFRDWVAERTGYPNHVAEAALAHAVPSAVEAAYRRSDLFEKRRRLMDEWATFCASPAPARKVIPLRPTP